MLKLSESQLEGILFDEEIKGFEYEQIEKADWEDQGKYQSCSVVFKHNEKYYTFEAQRTGTHYRGYDIEFFDTDVLEVRLEEVVVKRWVIIEEKEEQTTGTDVECCAPNEG